MWIVSLALRRPYLVAVLSLLILLLGGMATGQMRRDIFPAIDIPVVLIVWNFPGLSAEDMERRVVLLSERGLSSTVNGISRIESQSLSGIGLLRIYFEEHIEIGAAIAQISATSQTSMRAMPPGMVSPVIIQFNAANVPVSQLTLSGETASEQELFDYGLNFLRLRLFSVPGLSTPAPYGGRQRQVMIDIDPTACAAQGLAPQDVLDALLRENLILPAGTMRVGRRDYDVTVNNSPLEIAEFGRIPVRTEKGITTYIGDVARVRDGSAVQQNIVRVNGRRATYLAILKKADASTITVVDSVREMLPMIQKTAPDGIDVSLDFDESRFVRAAIGGVLHEGWVSSLLVSAMVLIFLGSWRSVLIICTSIPLAILVALLGLYATNETLNVMTLGGLSLAIGMLVDDATVEVENVHRNRHLGLPLTRAIMTGASEIATPALAATLTICIVFFPVVLLEGPARFLFTPLAKSVVFSMLASYALSRTLVPVLARMLLASEPVLADANGPVASNAFFAWCERGFAALQRGYDTLLGAALNKKAVVLTTLVVLVGLACALAPTLGMDFFPNVDAGQMRMHVRGPAGLRIEETELLVADIEREIRDIVPANELSGIVDTIGVPTALNLGFVQSDNLGGQDAEITVALAETHRPTREYEAAIRERTREKFPDALLYFQAADIVSRVLNFGMSAVIDVEIQGRNLESARQLASTLKRKMALVPGVVDIRTQQVLDHPALHLEVDRTVASNVGVSQQDVARALITSLSSSALVSPSYWLSPANAVNYLVAVQTPIADEASIDALMATPLGNATMATSNMLGRNQSAALSNVARLSASSTAALISHDLVQRVVNVQCGVVGRDLGGVATDIRQAIAELGELPPGVSVQLRGQPQSMQTAFNRLGLGLILSVVLVYLLLATLYQSWLDPLIIIMAVPGALVGVMVMLALTHTSINVESLMGTIMAVGVAVSNSILLVSFANEQREEHDALAAAMLAGKARLRPVLMTALAMILGMLPMAMGLGEGAEQNAPLGRAVVGGLLVATCTTLFVVPCLYAVMRRQAPSLAGLDAAFDAALLEPTAQQASAHRGPTPDATQGSKA